VTTGGTTGGTTTTGPTGGTTTTGPIGGTNALGGTVATSTGGSGATSTGGNATNAGGSNVGGGTTTGGKATGGGTSSAGAGTGGKATGGTSSSGGSATTGGAPSTGGAAPGACVESACGSHKWSCWRMPTPASEGLPNAQSYADLGNGAVRDNNTCLVWEKANPSTGSNWQTQSDRCAALASSGYAGFSDWRLPTRVEMASITDVTRGSTGYPAIFTVTSGYYTTKSFWFVQITQASGMVWGYGTNGFTSNAIASTGSNLVARCVRGNGTGEDPHTLAVEPLNHYTVTGTGTDATVLDNYTGLIWQQTYSTSRMAFSAAASYCASQSTGGLTGWRVPTLTELASLVNEARVGSNATNGAVNLTAFPNTNGSCGPDGWYWASEPSLVGGEGWGISYCDGYTGWNSGASSSDWNYFIDGWVRCVHN
jgi:hypothetical protein